MGNTCYLNTIVQVLASLKCFRMALSEVESAMNQQERIFPIDFEIAKFLIEH